MDKLYNDDWLTRHDWQLTTGENAVYWTFTPAQADGSMIVMLHGMKGNHAGLTGLAWEYHLLHPTTTIVMPDLPGYGIAEPFKALTKDNIGELYNEFIKQLLDQLGAPQYKMVAHSFGAIVLYQYLAWSQDPRVTKAYLFGTHVTGATYNGWFLNTYRISASLLPKAVRRVYLYNRLLNYIESVWFTKTANPDVRKAIYAHRVQELASQQLPTLMSSFKLSRAVNLLKLPIPSHTELLFVNGAKDNVARPKHILELAKMNDARVVTMPGVGHYMVNEEPVACATELV